MPSHHPIAKLPLFAYLLVIASALPVPLLAQARKLPPRRPVTPWQPLNPGPSQSPRFPLRVRSVTRPGPRWARQD